ncbi:hypothetical protein Dda_0318 [Drechslerella dactyloides]|uniref:Uncharacterized protein n=1 Tax=Drechslerella dactyloides TaxID=74499 RepID=A0AAD6NLU9_DREDA|nr:hypothetical protein Dda_0318 [Drechslerella dactyloides]
MSLSARWIDRMLPPPIHLGPPFYLPLVLLRPTIRIPALTSHTLAPAFLGGVIGGLIGCVGMAALLFRHVRDVHAVRLRLDGLQDELNRFDDMARQLLEALEEVEVENEQKPSLESVWAHPYGM